MRTQQQFYLIKLKSNRIRNAKYELELSLEQARRNGEVVSVGQNQVIMSLFGLQGKTFDQSKIQELFLEKRRIKRRKNSPENRERLKKVEEEIDSILFVPEIISVQMNNKRHYNKIIYKSFRVNGYRYVRLLCGAGHSRRNTVIFVREDYGEPLKRLLNNGHRPIPMVYAKANAYLALAYSGIVPVSEPIFCVIPDMEIQREEEVEFVKEIDDPDAVEKRKMQLDFNLFDGQGLISPRLARLWAEEIDIDYIPASFIIRSSFLKGMVCTFDFHKFAEEFVEDHYIIDVWGDKVNIRDVDLVLTASQFKLWEAYDSCQDYVKKSRENGMLWGITRVSPKKDKNTVFTNYQFLQVLKLKQEDVENLCSKTVDYFRNVIRDNPMSALIYLMGKLSEEEDPEIFKKIDDPVAKAIILNNKLLHDPYIRMHLQKSLNAKIRESYIGNLLVDGNYSFMIADPFAFAEHLFSLPVKGLLKRGEHYSAYWNQKKVQKVSAMRAPLTWRSEVNVLNLQDTEEMNDWYQYLYSGIIYNVHGVDDMIHAD